MGEAPSREGQPENYQQLTINLHLNRTRQYGQSIVNAILYKPFRAGRVNLKEQQQQHEKKTEKTIVCKDSSPPNGVVSGRVLGHRWHVHTCCQPGDTPTVR